MSTEKSTMGKKHIAGLLGAALLIIGVFLPVISAPMMGTINLFKNGQGDGVIIFGLAIVSIIFILIKRYKVLWVTGLLSLIIIIGDFISMSERVSSAKADIASKAGNTILGAIPKMVADSIQLQWGWGVLIIGVILVLMCATEKR